MYGLFATRIIAPELDWCEDCFQYVNSNKFKFTVIGDVNGDYLVTEKDVEHAFSRFGSVRGDADWASSYDINGDDVIDNNDISTISSHLGEYRYPPVCAMKTKTDGYFYVPNVAINLLKIEMLFDNQNITGDQTDGTSPYSTITAYPDGFVDMKILGLFPSFLV